MVQCFGHGSPSLAITGFLRFHAGEIETDGYLLACWSSQVKSAFFRFQLDADQFHPSEIGIWKRKALKTMYVKMEYSPTPHFASS